MNEIIKKNAIPFGITLGLLSVLITGFIYVFDINLFLSGWVTFFKVIIYSAIIILLLNKTKKELGGFMSFKEAFTTFFYAAALGIIIATSFDIVLFNLIDPSLKDSLKEITINFTVELLEKFKTPTSEIKKAVEEIKNTDQFSVLQQIKGLFTYFLISAIFGLVFSAIFKKNKPVF
jgi:hypothetical protein